MRAKLSAERFGCSGFIAPPAGQRTREKERAAAPAHSFESKHASCSLTVVPDAIKRADQIVRDKQRAVMHHRHVNRTPEVIAVVVPSFGKRLGLSRDVTVFLEE